MPSKQGYRARVQTSTELKPSARTMAKQNERDKKAQKGPRFGR